MNLILTVSICMFSLFLNSNSVISVADIDVPFYTSIQNAKYNSNLPVPFVENQLFGYVDKTGKCVIEAKYVEAEEFSEGLALVRKSSAMDMQYGYINEHGEEVIPCKYTRASKFNEGYAWVSESNKWNTEGEFEYYYIDKNGNNVFKRTFKATGNFSNGYAPVLIDGEIYVAPNHDIMQKWRYIDTKGRIASNEIYDYAYEFSNGYAIVVVNGEHRIIDTKFNYVANVSFDNYKDAVKYLETLILPY